MKPAQIHCSACVTAFIKSCSVCSVGRREEDLCSSGVTILNQDFTSALQTLQDAQSKAIGAPKVMNYIYSITGLDEYCLTFISWTNSCCY